MPLAMDAKELMEISLTADEAKPAAARPVFEFYHLTSREWRERLKLLESWAAFWKSRQAAQAAPQAAPAGQDTEAYHGLMRATYAALGAQAASWRNVRDRKGLDVPFSGGALDAVLNDDEARELLDRCSSMSRLSVTEKNASESPSPTSGDESAAPAAGANPPSAGSAPASANPLGSSASSAAAAIPSAASAPVLSVPMGSPAPQPVT
jgi:hypothetical protein